MLVKIGYTNCHLEITVHFTNNNPESYTSVIIVKSALFWLMGLLACLTILTHVAQVSGITFKVYAYTALFLMLVMPLLVWIFFHEQYKKVTRYDPKTLLFLVIICLGGAFLASFFNSGATKISTDLFYYVPNAVYHLQNPDSPMDFAIHFIETGSEPFTSYFVATSVPFEYTQAVIAYFLNIDYLSAYFLFSPALLGCLIPIALYYLICQFVDPKLAVVGALFTVAIVLLLGETSRTPGTWSFPNIYSGKVFFISIGIPLFAAATVNSFRTASPSDWALTFAATTAMVGATSSTMAILPPLAVVLVVACAAVSGGEYKTFIKNLFLYSCSLSYLIVYTLVAFFNLHSDVGTNSPISEDFPVTFLGHAGFFFEKSGPATALVLIVSTVLALLMTSGKVRKFTLVWVVATIVLFLNPIVAPLLIKYLTTPNIYWRLFYIYPLPLLLGLTGAKLFEYAGRFSKPVQLGFISVTFFILFISHFVPFTTSVLYLRTEFAWPRYKMPPASQRVALAVIAVTPPGPMLAPLPLGGIVAMLSAKYPQMRVFNEAEKVWFGERGLRTEIDNRICASEFVNGDKPDCFPEFQALLGYTNLRSVVIAKSAILDSKVSSALNENGFTNRREIDDLLLVYWK
ncbi:hypothetical protein SAMN05216315_13523 [Nitrosospira sp. Nsp18]|nr:hypothetical protein SAMN05216315_13523 [Nitrosospira sp. Nsp18]